MCVGVSGWGLSVYVRRCMFVSVSVRGWVSACVHMGVGVKSGLRIPHLILGHQSSHDVYQCFAAPRRYNDNSVFFQLRGTYAECGTLGT